MSKRKSERENEKFYKDQSRTHRGLIFMQQFNAAMILESIPVIHK